MKRENWRNWLLGATVGLSLTAVSAPALLAQTASLLPNAVQYFMDGNGKPLANGKVFFYEPGGTTPKTTWTTANESVPQANPVVLGSSGRPVNPIYGDGSYRQIVKDQFNNVIWDFNTASASGGGGTSPAFSEGVMVGTIVAWANTTLPAKYLYTAGQAIARATYPALFTAVTFSQPILCVSGIATISVPANVSDLIPLGAPIEAPCFAPGTTVFAKSSGQLVMSTNATTTTSVVATLFPWGNGNGSTTFNVPNINGRTIVGRDNMNSTVAAVLSSLYYGSDPNAINVLGGSQSQVFATKAYLPRYTLLTTITDPGHVHQVPVNNPSTATASFIAGSNAASLGNTATTNTAFTGITASTDSGGGGIISAVTMASGGSGYTNGTQVLTISGGICPVQPTVSVTVSGGVAASPVIVDAGYCGVPPTTPAATTGGGGTGATINLAYSALPFPVIQPSVTADYIIKALPDDTPGGPGVSSLGGMTGAIACGTGVICTANTISVAISGVTGPGTSINNTIPTWNGTGGNVLKSNPTVGISTAAALQIDSGYGPTSVLYVPPNFTNSSLMVGNGGTNLVHNAGTFTATITGNTTLHVSAIISGTVPVEPVATATLSGAGVTSGTQIRAQLSGTPGGVGDYTITSSTNVGSPTTMTAISLQGYYNTGVGLTNFLNATTASYNTTMGFEGMEFCTTCFANSGFGEATLIYNQTGNGNTAMGWKALLGANGFSFGDYNTAVGYASGWATGGVNGGTQNTSLGAFSLSSTLLSGPQNLGIGYDVAPNLTSGANNVLMGAFSGFSLTTGSNNTFIGPTTTGAAITTGSNNTIIGNCPAQAAGTTGLVLLCDGGGIAYFNSTVAISGFANPTATIGLTAVNGAATTAIRSDGAPALSQAITPNWTGKHIFSGTIVNGGNISAPAWTTGGLMYSGSGGNHTDTTSSGTVAAAYDNLFGQGTILATNPTTYTNYFGVFVREPVASTNVTFTNKFALGAESAKLGTSNQWSVASNGHTTNEGVTATGATGTGKYVYDTNPTVVGIVNTSLTDLSGASAGQIKFPATQNASANANTLDDYAEASWTPIVSFGGGTTGITYSTQTGFSTKVGRLVTISAELVFTSKGSSTGAAIITGFPITSLATTSPCAVQINNFSAGTITQVQAAVGTASTTINLSRYAAGANTALADTDFTNTSVLRVSCTYAST